MWLLRGAHYTAAHSRPAHTLGAVSLLKAASTVSLLTLVSRVTGLARDLIMASMFGANALTDAFNVAFRIPNLFRRLFAEGAFSQAFVPVLAAARTQHGEDATRQLISHVATVLAWALLVTCIAGVLGAPALVWLLASGLRQSGEGFDAAVVMTRWMFPYIGFMSMVALSAGVLNTWKRFAVPAATPVLLNFSMIGAAWWGAPLLAVRGIEPIYAMAGGVMLGGVLQLAVQVPALLRLGLLPRIGVSVAALRAAWADADVRRILRLMAPALLGVGVAQISLMVNTQIASYLAPGSVTWLFYADRLMEFPTSLLGVALGVVLTPQLSAARAAGDAAQYSAMLDWGLRIVVLLAVPCAVALLAFAQPLVATLFHYGALQDSDVRQIALALSGYGAGLIGLVAIKVLAPGYYASQDIRTPVKVAIVVLLISQLLNVALGGSLHQSIQGHWQEDVSGTSHSLEIRPNSRVSQLFQAGTQINSLHRQSIKDLAPGLVATAHDPRDGTIEAYESQGQQSILGIQWHPEFLAKNCSHNQKLFDYLVQAL